MNVASPDDADRRHTGADDDLPSLQVGDHVEDREEDEDGPTLLVVGLPYERAAERGVGDGKTVAEHNPGYSEHDLVVEVVYPERTCAEVEHLPRYAFPRSRLERVAPVHSDDQEGEASDAMEGGR
jgi:hypothetical protein